MSSILNKKISVVIPCYNESENIQELYSRLVVTLENVISDFEIIFIDNKSTDSSEDIFRNLAAKDKRVVVLFFSRNFGNSQYGYSAGTEYATGDAVIWMEGDLQDPPEVIPHFIQKWQEGYDVVYGVRPKAAGSRFMKLARRVFYRLFEKLSYLDIPRDAGDFSLIDRRVVNILNAMPERSRFVRGLRAWAGFRHTGIMYERNERKRGVTSNPSFRRNVWWAKKFIFSFSHAPIEFISSAAFWVVICFVLVTAVVLGKLFYGTLSFWTGIISIASFAVGTVIMVSLSILAETLGIIFEEVKQRPKYIISETLNHQKKNNFSI